jgi:lipoprotein NlpD
MRILSAVGVMFLIGACINPQVGIRRTSGSNQTVVRAQESGDAHRVEKGETLYAIAFKHAVDFRDLAAWNRIAEPYTIYPGQRLRISNPARAPQLEASAVRSGGTSSSVSTTSVMPIADSSVSSVTSTSTATTTAPTSVNNQTIQAGTAVSSSDGVSVGAIAPPPPVARTESLSPTNAEGLPTGFTAPSNNTAASASMPSTVASSTTVAAATSNAASTPLAPAVKPAAPTPVAAVPAPAPVTIAQASPRPAPAVSSAPTALSTPNNTAKPSAGSNGWGWPANGKIITTFAAVDPKRQGIDVAGNAGDSVYAAKSGEVVYSGRGITGYGELIVIKHDDSTLSAYGHNRSRMVKEGQRVAQGQTIAEMGKDATGRQLLHFEVRRNGKPIDPMTVLPRR